MLARRLAAFLRRDAQQRLGQRPTQQFARRFMAAGEQDLFTHGAQPVGHHGTDGRDVRLAQQVAQQRVLTERLDQPVRQGEDEAAHAGFEAEGMHGSARNDQYERDARILAMRSKRDRGLSFKYQQQLAKRGMAMRRDIPVIPYTSRGDRLAVDQLLTASRRIFSQKGIAGNVDT